MAFLLFDSDEIGNLTRKTTVYKFATLCFKINHKVRGSNMTMEKNTSIQTTWEEISETNAWPDPILLKNMTADRLPGRPYSRGGFRNRVTGKNSEPELTAKIFFVGKFPAIRRTDLVD